MVSNHLYRALGLLSAAALGLAGCATPIAGPSGNYASAIGTAPVTANPTPYSGALVCMAGYARNARLVAPRIAVGRIADYTGKSESDGSGRKITQGASLMAMSAFAKAGMPLVERFDTSVSELELKYANNKLISDAPNPAPDQAAEYRRILAGQVPGSDFYVAGGLTELNFNIRSSGADLTGGSPDAKELKGSFRARMFVMNIGLDMRLINTRTLEVVDVISYQKQVVGREVGIGLFDFLGGNVFDVSAGAGALEPMQLAVRALVERAVVEMTANLYGMPGPRACLASDPLGDGTVGITGGYVPAYNNLGTNNAETRSDPSRWNARRDSAVRGRY
ncbi:MAG: holdfast anchoring protein HfaB [Phenylobacterium sp.]|nr:holdfast anchoring protein HfaB [Phenylobacterium sp.]